MTRRNYLSLSFSSRLVCLLSYCVQYVIYSRFLRWWNVWCLSKTHAQMAKHGFYPLLQSAWRVCEVEASIQTQTLNKYRQIIKCLYWASKDVVRKIIHRIHKWRTRGKKQVPSHEREVLQGKQKLQIKTFSELAECLARLPPKVTLSADFFWNKITWDAFSL